MYDLTFFKSCKSTIYYFNSEMSKGLYNIESFSYSDGRHWVRWCHMKLVSTENSTVVKRRILNVKVFAIHFVQVGTYSMF
jgi:hypothetical protein